MKKLLTTLLSIIALTTSAFAQTPSDDSLRQMMALAGVDKMLDSSINSMIKVQRDMFEQKLKQSSQLSHDTITQMGAVYEKHLRQSVMGLFSEQTKEQMADLYIMVAKNHLTQREVDDNIRFLQSESGQSISQKTPVIMTEYSQQVQLLLMQSLIQNAVNSEESQRQMRQEMQAILEK